MPVKLEKLGYCRVKKIMTIHYTVFI